MLTINNVILGSKSPRRKELLQSIISSFETVTKEIEEIIPEEILPKDAAKYLAKLKASAYLEEVNEGKMVITSDTVVLHNNHILGKPKDETEAYDMLSSLAAHTHEVITGVCIKNKTQEILFDDTTKVKFKPLSDEEIMYYIKNYKPYDKAGAYGIQEWIGMVAVEKIEGCFYNVMGLPVAPIYDQLKINIQH